jgi:hypothetical protein
MIYFLIIPTLFDESVWKTIDIYYSLIFSEFIISMK